MRAELLFHHDAALGEACMWEAKTQTLYWVDILGNCVHSFRNGKHRECTVERWPSCLASLPNGKLLVGRKGGIAELDPKTTTITERFAFSNEPENNRSNDGKCDPHGRFLIGTMDASEQGANGALYSFDGTMVTPLLTGCKISNGMTWSPDGKTFYHIDTPTRVVRAYDYDLETGHIANQRVVVAVPEALGWPDGMTSDKNGNLWIAMWGGGAVTKWDSRTGTLLETIPVPAPHASNCVFGGNNMNELFVTSARKGLTEFQLAEYPLSGSVFRIETPIEGGPTFEFKE